MCVVVLVGFFSICCVLRVFMMCRRQCERVLYFCDCTFKCIHIYICNIIQCSLCIAYTHAHTHIYMQSNQVHTIMPITLHTIENNLHGTLLHISFSVQLTASLDTAIFLIIKIPLHVNLYHENRRFVHSKHTISSPKTLHISPLLSHIS